jgi:hypothetical protein
MLTAAGRENWAEATDLALRLEQSYGLPPVLRRERARWWLAQGALDAARADLRRVREELPGDLATEELLREWQRRVGGKDL